MGETVSEISVHTEKYHDASLLDAGHRISLPFNVGIFLPDILDIPINESIWPSLVDSATFKQIKKDFANTTPVVTQKIWRDPEKFFNKGRRGQWSDVLTGADLEFYDVAADRSLEPDARRWTEQGTLGFADPKEI